VHRRPLGRIALLLPGGVALLLGLDAGLLLLGLPAPLRWSRLPDVHGVVMVLGFVGTVVALERAVALRRTWGYLAPAGFGVGALLLVSAAPAPVGGGVLVLGAAALVAVYVPLWRRQPAGAVVVQAGGGVLALGAALLSLGGVPMPVLLPWLAGFLILTISGERLELARVALLAPHAEMLAVGASALIAAGVLATVLWPVAGYPLLGVGVLALTAWLTRWIARSGSRPRSSWVIRVSRVPKTNDSVRTPGARVSACTNRRRSRAWRSIDPETSHRMTIVRGRRTRRRQTQSTGSPPVDRLRRNMARGASRRPCGWCS